MKKLILPCLLIIAFSTAVKAQETNTYPVVVSFNSMCCGVPGNEPLVNLIRSFKNQNKMKQIAVDSIGPMGREGEYYLAFRLKEFSAAQKIKFIEQLKKIVPAMKERGSAEILQRARVSKADLSSGATITLLKY